MFKCVLRYWKINFLQHFFLLHMHLFKLNRRQQFNLDMFLIIVPWTCRTHFIQPSSDSREFCGRSEFGAAQCPGVQKLVPDKLTTITSSLRQAFNDLHPRQHETTNHIANNLGNILQRNHDCESKVGNSNEASTLLVIIRGPQVIFPGGQNLPREL